MNTFGTSVRLTIFGVSHGRAVGCAVDGLPAGFKLDTDAVQRDIERRRAAFGGIGATPRHEADTPDVICGLYNGSTDGTPLIALFYNKSHDDSEYPRGLCRPSHADAAAMCKYGGANDPNGGGQFSGRMTLPLVFAGAVARQYISARGVRIGSHIASIGEVCDRRFDPAMRELPQLDMGFPLVDASVREGMEAALKDAADGGDSLGGTVECAVTGLPVGVGEPFFDTLEGVLSHMLFAIPAVRAVEFGSGFDICRMRGSEANDGFNPDMTTVTNRSGGINGGMSNGMPVVFRVGFRPIPTVAQPQSHYDANLGAAVTHTFCGRHDVCVLPRAAVTVEVVTAFCLLDMLITGGFCEH